MGRFDTRSLLVNSGSDSDMPPPAAGAKRPLHPLPGTLNGLRFPSIIGSSAERGLRYGAAMVAACQSLGRKGRIRPNARMGDSDDDKTLLERVRH